MLPPDQRQFEYDLLSAAFRSGVQRGYWDLAEKEAAPDKLAWPSVILWIGAAPRTGAPERFYIALDCEGYRAAPPTGTFWDPTGKATLAFTERPKGKANSRFSTVFRTDWEKGRAFYHPYDRLAAQSHPEWPRQQPHHIWDSNHTIVDHLKEFHALLQSGDYLGI